MMMALPADSTLRARGRSREGHAGHLVFVEEIHHGVEALAGAEAWCGGAVDFGGNEREL